MLQVRFVLLQTKYFWQLQVVASKVEREKGMLSHSVSHCLVIEFQTAPSIQGHEFWSTGLADRSA